ncbi:MAG TPA: HAD-IA family hydrolase [Candidatus Acidoferrales bacterium]|nr:HAD-IA family hydrolase [Candidatus Acidoferrales bacterium]
MVNQTSIRAESLRAEFSGIRLLIFDLDGTLIDSRLDLVYSVNATLEHLGQVPLPHEVIESYVGNGVAALVHRALGPGASEEKVADAQEFFLAYYRTHMLDNTVLYPGVREALDALGSRSMAVLTNKPVRFSEEILKGLDAARYFRFVYGGNSFSCKKPDPVGVQTLLRDVGISTNEAMMVGDSAVDVRTARNAGIWSCGVSYGLGLEGMRADPPDLMLDTLADLPLYLNGKTDH